MFFYFLSWISLCQPILVSKIPVWLSVHECKNRPQPSTENTKCRYRIDFENLLVREIHYCYPVPFAHPYSVPVPNIICSSRPQVLFEQHYYHTTLFVDFLLVIFYCFFYIFFLFLSVVSVRNALVVISKHM
ncbi:hypothetical protein Hanom_Chr09g00801321 [Helianthus anomalus]